MGRRPLLSRLQLNALETARARKPLGRKTVALRVAEQAGVVSVTPKADRRKNQKRETITPKKTKEAEKVADKKNCKPRPTRTGGSGNSRPFVPYCDRK